MATRTRKRRPQETVVTAHYRRKVRTNIREGRPWNWGIRYSINLTDQERQAHSDRRRGKGLGPRPDLWLVGPDPKLKRLRRRWLMARCQAKFWGQVWRLSWEQYRDTWSPHIDELGRTKESLNLVRRDTTRGWTIKNVHLMNRLEAMLRKTKGKHRARPKGLGKGTHHWRNKHD